MEEGVKIMEVKSDNIEIQIWSETFFSLRLSILDNTVYNQSEKTRPRFIAIISDSIENTIREKYID